MFLTSSVAGRMSKCSSGGGRGSGLVNFYVSKYEMSPEAEQVERMH